MLGEVPGRYTFSTPKEAEEVQRKDLFLELTGDVFTGGLNQNWVYRCTTNNEPDQYILRIPKTYQERKITENALKQEFDSIGATKHGITFTLRSITEQAEFIDRVRERGLKVVDYLDMQANAMVFPFYEGDSLDKYVAKENNAKFRVIENTLEHLTEAHKTGIVFGDRWCTNTLISKSGEIAEVDFDIELIGESTKVATFELSQTLYHLIHFSDTHRSEVTNGLVTFYQRRPDLLDMYDLNLLEVFLRGQQSYFSERYRTQRLLYEEVVPPGEEVAQFAAVLESITQGDRAQAKPLVIFGNTTNLSR